MAEHELHVGRLANHTQKRSHRRQVQHIEQAPHPHATDLFVMGKRQLQWPVQGVVSGIEHGVDGQRNETFHVTTATPVHPSIAHGRLERRNGPGLPRRRHHVGVAGQQDPGQLTRTGAGEQVGLLAALILDDQRLDTLAQQQLAHVLDQGQVRF